MESIVKFVLVVCLCCVLVKGLPIKGKTKRAPQGFYPGPFQAARPGLPSPPRINGPPLAINTQPQFVIPPRPGSVWLRYPAPAFPQPLLSRPPVLPQQRFEAPRPVPELPGIATMAYADKPSQERHGEASPPKPHAPQPYYNPVDPYFYPQQAVYVQNPVPQAVHQPLSYPQPFPQQYQPVYQPYQPPYYHHQQEYLPKKEKKDFKSCLDYLRHGSSTNGGYTISDSDGDHYQVWCDFHSEPGFAWTLIMSHTLRNTNRTAFCDSSLSENIPVHQNSPNWDDYRLSKERMDSLIKGSSHWRSTTGFPLHGVDFRDYVRGNFEDFNIMEFEGRGECKPVDYINIRGFPATQTKAQFWQRKGKQALHIDSAQGECDYRPFYGTIVGENNFGFYCEGSHTLNRSFRGTENDASNTQWWFGGSMYDQD